MSETLFETRQCFSIAAQLRVADGKEHISIFQLRLESQGRAELWGGVSEAALHIVDEAEFGMSFGQLRFRVRKTLIGLRRSVQPVLCNRLLTCLEILLGGVRRLPGPDRRATDHKHQNHASANDHHGLSGSGSTVCSFMGLR